MVDVMSHLNQLNYKLQGKRNLIFPMLEETITFEKKVSIFAQDFEKKTLFYFPSLQKYNFPYYMNYTNLYTLYNFYINYIKKHRK